MRVSLLILLVFLVIDGAVDFYIWKRSLACRNPFWSRLQKYSAIFLALALTAVMILPARKGPEYSLLSKMWLLFAYMSIYIPKYIAVILDLIASLPRLWGARRMHWLTVTGIAAAILSFCAIWWGSLVNRFRLQTVEVEIPVEGLPRSFDGLRIVQFSDLHTGTFAGDTAFVSRIVDSINALHPDVIVFTGDIVNRQSDEMLPFVGTLSRLHAPMGVYAILGNHDYGDYRNWRSQADREANLELLYDAYRRTGIDLMLNTHRWLKAGGDSIALIGVENIGDPPFKTYGSLRAAYPDLGDSNVKVLLSHNPQHWVDSIAGNPAVNIPLTLAGHTHAMQMEVGGISPAALRYPTWGGLYDSAAIAGDSTDSAGGDADRSRSLLYVNIGSGTVGIPVRLGATPEITVLTLRRK